MEDGAHEGCYGAARVDDGRGRQIGDVVIQRSYLKGTKGRRWDK
jgi:hypothetical protein